MDVGKVISDVTLANEVEDGFPLAFVIVLLEAEELTVEDVVAAVEVLTGVIGL